MSYQQRTWTSPYDGVIDCVVNDIEEVLNAARHMAFREPQERPVLNPLSTLPESQIRIKEALKERIQTLVAAYVSLATFVEDEKAYRSYDGSDASMDVYRDVLQSMQTSEKEMQQFLREVASSLSTLA